MLCLTGYTDIHQDDQVLDDRSFFSKYHEMERLGRQLTTLALVQLQNRINSMQFETAKKTVRKFFNPVSKLYQ